MVNVKKMTIFCRLKGTSDDTLEVRCGNIKHMRLRRDIDEFINSLPKDVTLVAASKYVDSKIMKEMLDHGICNFGENRTDAFLNKYYELFGENITWHFIGHLQTNKAKDIINKIDYLHSLDSLKLAKLINENRTSPLNVFIEVSINEEESKNGLKVNEVKPFIEEILSFRNIKVIGLMMMSIKASDNNSLDQQFSKLVNLRSQLENELNIKLPYLSMGMSDDYLVAIKNKATHIRLGRILFED